MALLHHIIIILIPLLDLILVLEIKKIVFSLQRRDFKQVKVLFLLLIPKWFNRFHPLIPQLKICFYLFLRDLLGLLLAFFQRVNHNIHVFLRSLYN
jgi:hypothetical protein